MKIASQQQPTSKFDHKFEGWSVWLEPNPKQVHEMVQVMKYLSIHCGGSDQGTHPFDLHCTLLYNFNPCHLIRRSQDVIYCEDEEEKHEELQRRIGTQLLQKCIHKYIDVLEKRNEYWIKERSIELTPSDFYFFPYPKESDNGRGFGCVISMMLLENNDSLQDLQHVVSDVFPPDERHGKNSSSKDIQQASNINPPSDSNRQYHKKPFIPHMALVYAPEIYHDYLKQYTDSQLKNANAHWLYKPIQAKYLSLWCTKGTLKEWKLITRIDLEDVL